MITMRSQKPANKALKVVDNDQLLEQSDQLKPKDGEGVRAERPLNLGLERWPDREVKVIEGFVFVSLQFTVRHHRIPWLRILSLLRGDVLTN